MTGYFLDMAKWYAIAGHLGERRATEARFLCNRPLVYGIGVPMPFTLWDNTYLRPLVYGYRRQKPGFMAI